MGKCITMNNERKPKKVMNMRLKGKCQKRPRYKWEAKVRTCHEERRTWVDIHHGRQRQMEMEMPKKVKEEENR
jgi:hypothetical protein